MEKNVEFYKEQIEDCRKRMSIQLAMLKELSALSVETKSEENRKEYDQRLLDICINITNLRLNMASYMAVVDILEKDNHEN